MIIDIHNSIQNQNTDTASIITLIITTVNTYIVKTVEIESLYIKNILKKDSYINKKIQKISAVYKNN